MIMESLSCAEREIANEFCKGFSDKEVADNLDKSGPSRHRKKLYTRSSEYRRIPSLFCIWFVRKCSADSN